MKLFLLPLTFCLTTVCFAAPHEVALTMQRENGQALTGKQQFSISGPQNFYKTGTVADGKAVSLSLEPGFYSVYLRTNLQEGLPGKLWHGLAVSSEAKDVTKWDLKVPPMASIQGRILRPDGKPAAGCLVSVQSGTSQALSYDFAPVVMKNPAVALQLLDRIALGAQHAYAATRTDEDGNFLLSGLVPDNYAIDVFYPQTPRDFTSPQSGTWFTMPFAPALKSDADKGQPTKVGEWKVPEHSWDWLFDSKVKHGGAESKFTGQGKVETGNGVLRLGVGDDMTGLNWPDLEKVKLPRNNYEITFDARRVEGVDFFSGLTFPWGDKPISWIVGGWGGMVVGLSNVNGFAAVENETTRTMQFEDSRWYRLRLRVSKPKIEAWIDEEKVINLPTQDKEFTIRWSVEPSQPLGFATWQTGGELRDIRIRSLEADELAAIEKSVQE